MSPQYPTAAPPDSTGDRARIGETRPTRMPPGPEGPTAGGLPFPPYTAEPAISEVRLVRAPLELGRPFEERVGAAPRAFSGDYWGAFSLEHFANAGSLTYTHEDAGGWLKYLEQFQPANFWYKDANVRPWAYYEDYDNWQDTYGMDAVLAVYHSGHGGMDGAGKFYLPLGADWGGLGTTVTSDRMRLGNEQVRYVFLSTCLSLRVLDGHTPIRTWSPANLGFRMLFGFETVSWDSPDYGANFWREWNKNKSFSTAWLDASWAIAHDQAPSVVACGATAAEAQNRVYNERLMYWESVSRAWWWWRWYYAASAALARRESIRALPPQLLIAELVPTGRDIPTNLRRTIEQLGLPIRIPREITTNADGGFLVGEGSTRISFGADGSFEAQLDTPNYFNHNQLDASQAVSLARDAVSRFGLDADASLVLDRVRLSAEGGASDDGSGRREGPFIVGTTVQFRQMINGLPVITPDAGTVRVTIDNDARVTSVQSSLRRIGALHDRARDAAMAPGEERPAIQGSFDDATLERTLGAAWRTQLAQWVARGDVPVQYTVVPGSTEIGYEVRGNRAAIVARRAIEVDFGGGYRKRYWITAPIFE